MGLVPEWFNKGERPAGSLGQYTQSNMFSNPTYEQQGKAGRLAQLLRNPNQPQMSMQPNMGMQPGAQPMQLYPQYNNSMLMNPNDSNMTNWNSQYGGY